MERIYLVASLAIVVTFATLSSGFKSLQQLSQQRGQHPSALARWASELKTHLHPGAAEEAQMLAEMNLPPAPAQARVAEQAIQQGMAAAQCARETARRQAERAKRDAERMQAQISRQTRITASSPLSIDLKGLDGLDQRIQIRTAAIVRRFVQQNARMQIAAAKLQGVALQIQNGGQRRSPCHGRTDEQ